LENNNNLKLFFTGKLKVQIPVAKQNKIFYIKMISQNIFYFSNFQILSFLLFQKTNNPVNFFKNVFATFSKNRQFEDLFQKRFAGGICDLGGPRQTTAWHPIYRVSHNSSAGPPQSQIPVAKRFRKNRKP